MMGLEPEHPTPRDKFHAKWVVIASLLGAVTASGLQFFLTGRGEESRNSSVNREQQRSEAPMAKPLIMSQAGDPSSAIEQPITAQPIGERVEAVQPAKAITEISVNDQPMPELVRKEHLPIAGTFYREIQANRIWVDTEIDVTEAQKLSIDAEGEVSTLPTSYFGPEGQGNYCDASRTLPSASYGRLIGKVGMSGFPFALSSHKAMPLFSSGRLYLGVNDCCNWDDNEGVFRVTIVLEGQER